MDLLAGFGLGSLLALSGALVTAGVVAGILAGLLGVGGGIVIVPVLYHLFTLVGIDEAVRMHVAVGTSLAAIIPTGASSAYAHFRRGAVDQALLRSWGMWILLGVVLGTVVGSHVSGEVLSAIFAVVAFLVALNMAFRPPDWTVAEELPRGPVRWLLGAVIGFLSVLMGIGGGTLSVPILTACRYPIRRAVGTAAAIGLLIAVPGAIGFAWSGLGVANRPPFSLGYVNLAGLALILPASALAAPLGARIAHAIAPLLLRRAFALFLFLTSLRMFYGLING